MRHIARLTFITLFVYLSLVGHSFAESQISESGVKAVFTYKLTKYIRWPSDARPLTICSMGDERKKDSIAASLEKFIQENNKDSIVVKRFITSLDVKKCNMLIIEDKQPMREAILAANGKAIVTVSDIENFARKGGMFEFIVTPDGNINMQLNYDNVVKNGVDINASLLEILKIVKD